MPQLLNTISKTPLIITLGDPCGIGSEIITKSWMSLRTQPEYTFAVIGDQTAFDHFKVDTISIQDLSEAQNIFANAIPILHRPCQMKAVLGEPNVGHANHIISWIKESFELCITHKARAMITAPIAKSVLYSSGFSFPGHTEYLGELSSIHGFDNNPVMLLMTEELKVALATIHIPVNLISRHLRKDVIISLGKLVNTSLIRDFNVVAPIIAMAGLNPHSGENGTIGTEEIDVIIPAIEALKAAGINITGPHPADSMFHTVARKGYDVAICMYHDQALIPLKTIDFWGGVNITLNLPIIRTSPDHGTGFNIAGKDVARPDSMIKAIKAASQLSYNRELNATR